MLRKIHQDEIDTFYDSLYLPYITELKRFRGAGDGMTVNVLRYNLCQVTMSAYVIVHDGEEAGFALVEDVGTDQVYRPMLFICEFYIKPEFRRQGIGSKAFHELLAGIDKPVFFAVLPENKGAVMFWQKQIEDNRLLPVKPDAGQREFAKGMQLFCFGKT